MSQLQQAGLHWSVWINWYEERLLAIGRSTEPEDAAYTDLPKSLPWNRGAQSVNIEILSRLDAMRPVFPGYPAPVIRNTDTGTALMRWSHLRGNTCLGEEPKWSWSRHIT